MKIIFKCVAIIIFALSCGSCKNKTSKDTLEKYNQTLEYIQTLEQLVSTTDFSTFSSQEIRKLYKIGNELFYDYNRMDLSPEQLSL